MAAARICAVSLVRAGMGQGIERYAGSYDRRICFPVDRDSSESQTQQAAVVRIFTFGALSWPELPFQNRDVSTESGLSWRQSVFDRQFSQSPSVDLYGLVRLRHDDGSLHRGAVLQQGTSYVRRDRKIELC